MKLLYRAKFESQNIDINKLRPHKSYDYLIDNRNASLKEILSEKERLKDFLIERKCPICESKKYSYVLKKDNLNIVRCSKCNVIYVNPVFNEKKYIEIYQTDSYQKIGKNLGENSHIYRRQRFGIERMNIIERYHNKNLKKFFLDIGCSTGFVIEEAKKRGWKAVGIELNPSAVQFARKRNLEVIDKPLEEIKFNNKFSDVGLYDVLEHLINPRELILKVLDLLDKNGNVYIYVPNWNSASVDFLDFDNSHFIWPVHHLTYFTPKTLKYFLEQNGFKVLYWETQGLDIYDWLWYLENKTNYDTKLINKFAEQIQFYINASGHGKNLRMYAKKI